MLSFHVKFVQTDKRTDGRRRTTVKQYAPDLSIQGHKKPSDNKNKQKSCKERKIFFELY